MFKNNGAETGGALYLVTAVDMGDNLIFSNTATVAGGGIANDYGVIDAQNDVIANNIAPLEGVYLTTGSLSARHWTLVDNGKYGFFRDAGTASFTNTIVASHTVAGLWGTGVTSDHALFFGNGTACAGGASCIDGLTGDPKFVDPQAGDFHIGPTSAAIDAGVNANVTTDMDGHSRPLCSGYDIGADEFMPPAPAATFASSAPVWLGKNVIFSNTTAFTGCASYLWAFGNGATSTPSPTMPTAPYLRLCSAAMTAVAVWPVR